MKIIKKKDSVVLIEEEKKFSYIESSHNFQSGPPGHSAYQIAIRNGFEGSEQQWLDSLKVDIQPPEDGSIQYSTEGQIDSVTIGSRVTLFNRDVNGTITSIEKDTYIKQFDRDVNGTILGWTIVQK